MSKKEYFLYTTIIAIVIWVGIIFIPISNSSLDKLYDKKIDSLNTLINNNNIKIKEQEKKDSIFQLYINKTDSQFVEQQNKINRLNKYYVEKIKAVDNASTMELYKSITDRYK